MYFWVYGVYTVSGPESLDYIWMITTRLKAIKKNKTTPCKDTRQDTSSKAGSVIIVSDFRGKKDIPTLNVFGPEV